jgi:CRP-like cAMP-binding protein
MCALTFQLPAQSLPQVVDTCQWDIRKITLAGSKGCGMSRQDENSTEHRQMLNQEYYSPQFGARLLSSLPVFRGFPERELAEIYCLGELRVFQRGANVIVEREPSSGLFVILEGLTAVYKTLDGGETAKLNVLGPGKVFGEMGLVDGAPRSATVACETSVVCYFLDGAVWTNAMNADLKMRSQFFENCALILARHVRELDEEFVSAQRQLWKYVLRQKEPDESTDRSPAQPILIRKSS